MRWIFRIASLVLPAAAFVALLVWSQGKIPVQLPRQAGRATGSIDLPALFDTITPASLRSSHQAIVRHPTRLTGSPGEAMVSQEVEAEFRQLGMTGDDLLVQTFPVTVPVTKHCGIAYESGGSPPDVSLLPFWPNIVRTCTTPPDGIVGEVIDAGDGSLKDLAGKDIRGNIALVRMTRGFDWLDAAKLGAGAILFRPTSDPTRYAKKILHFPANLPRFLTRGAVDSLIGKRVRIRARVDWEIRQARNVFGVLRPLKKSTETLVLLGYTDSWSVVPDLAPGHYEACSTASLLEIARGLAAQRKGLSRNVIFGAISGRCLVSEGARRLADALAGRVGFAKNRALLDKRLAAVTRHETALAGALAAYRSGDYWALDAAGESRLWKRYGAEAREALSSVLQRQVDRHIAAAGDRHAAAKLAWVEAGKPGEGPLFEEQRNAAARVRRAKSAAGAEATTLKGPFGDVLTAGRCRRQLGDALAETLDHARAEVAFQQGAVDVAKLFEPFDKTYFFFLLPSAAGAGISYGGEKGLCTNLDGARDAVVRQWLRWRGRPADDPAAYPAHMANLNVSSSSKGRPSPLRTYVGGLRREGTGDAMDLSERPFWQSNRAVFMLRGTEQPPGFQTPLDRGVRFEDLAAQTQLLAALAAQIGSGAEPMVHSGTTRGTVEAFSDFGGEVMIAGGSNSILPDRRVADSLVVLKGVYGNPFYVQKARDGFFRFPAIEFWLADHLMCDAYTLDERTGEITGARDMGPAGQRFPNSTHKSKLWNAGETRLTILLTRVEPTDIYRLVAPDVEVLTVDVLDARFRTPPDEHSLADYGAEGATILLPHGTRFYVVLKEIRGQFQYVARMQFGRKGRFVQSFLLGYSPDGDIGPLEESFWGPGYLAGRDRRIVFQEVDAAISLARANRQRLAGQVRRGLADAVALGLADKSEELLESGLSALRQKRYAESLRDIGASLAISSRAYPAVRGAVADAVSGILLYMFLLVPFSVFAERLLLGARDVRTRIAGTFAIFIAVFLLIRLLHPAYALVTSGMIVLVGFVIFMLCLLILGFVSGKFAERIAELRRSGGGASEGDSDVSRSSAAGAAFALGINSMRKRKVRTAYTLATLVLISFSLVCFTSPRVELMEREIVAGPAAFNGLLRRHSGDLSAPIAEFGDRATVIARRGKRLGRVRIVHQSPGGPLRVARVSGLLELQSEESRVTGVEKILLPGGRWFERNDEPVCYLSEFIAGELGIDPGAVAGGKVTVTLDGERRRVLGVFSASALQALRDIDGESLLPVETAALSGRQRQEERTRRLTGQAGAGGAGVAHIPAETVVIVPLDPSRGGTYHSLAIAFDKLSYGAMREAIDGAKDRTPMFLSYALDGLSFFGGKTRFVALEGLADVLVPLLLASCIVLNTMLGSVYERQKEISVYSAVGLSPRHVFYLFLAESLVYAVIGTVGGYLLGLCLQWASHASGGLLGLTINYSSRSAIYVCLTLMIAVIASTFFPARRAARIASPSERVTWSVPPEAEPGRLRFDLPFTYVGRDIVAIVPFLTAWFDARGEDSSGEFSASRPEVEVSWSEGRPTLTVIATLWLRPYDLGVSQRASISARPSDEPGIYVAHVDIEMLTGDLTSWRRTNARFVAILRGHLLGWRAVPQRGKQAMFERSRNILMFRPE